MSSGSAEHFVPATQSELSRYVEENAAGQRRVLLPLSGGTALNYRYAGPTHGVTVATSKLSKTMDYPARDMTITVEAGIRMNELTELLKGENQRLPVDVAQSRQATLGGAVATNTSGPRRFGCGTLRDYVIGVSAVDGQGRLFRAGGRVVKYVAGYDLCKLLVGSLGTLAVIAELTLKLRPMTETSALLWSTFDSFSQIDDTLQRLVTSAARPVAMEVLGPQAAAQVQSKAGCGVPTDRAVLCLGVEGTTRDTDWQLQTLQDECATLKPAESVMVRADEAGPVWQALTEFQVSLDSSVTFQANLLPSRTLEFVRRATEMGVAVQAHAGSGIVIGHLPNDLPTLNKAFEIITTLRQWARRNRGNLVIFHCDDQWKQRLSVFGDPEPSWPLMLNLKKELDPHNLLNAGRFIDGGMSRSEAVVSHS